MRTVLSGARAWVLAGETLCLISVLAPWCRYTWFVFDDFTAYGFLTPGGVVAAFAASAAIVYELVSGPPTVQSTKYFVGALLLATAITSGLLAWLAVESVEFQLLWGFMIFLIGVAISLVGLIARVRTLPHSGKSQTAESP